MNSIGGISLGSTSLGGRSTASSNVVGTPHGHCGQDCKSIVSGENDTVVLVKRAESSTATEESHPARSRDKFRHSAGGAERAYSMFRAEAMQRLKLHFRTDSLSSSALPEGYRNSESAGDVAAEILKSARAAARSSDRASGESYDAIRRSLADAALTTKAHLDTDAGKQAVDEAEILVSNGLDAFEKQAASVTASELNVSAKSKQRTSIEIRTQEGDVVRFDLRNVGRLALSDRSMVTDAGSSSLTELRISESSRLRIVVEGDLNDAELEAIRTIFATAEEIANEFFAGDMNAALEIAAGLEIDAEQLARVSMNFRSSTRISASQALSQSGPVAVAPSAANTAAESPDSPDAVNGPEHPAELGAHTGAADSDAESPAADATEVEHPAASPLGSIFGKLSDYLAMLADYLEQMTARFANGDGGSAHTAIRFDMKQSLHLEVLRSVMSVIAPEPSDHENGADGSAIQQLADSIHQPARQPETFRA